MQRKEADRVDKLVGQNIKIQRLKKRMSQEALGEALGITFQQVQKYEKGKNRVGSGRLHSIATILEVPVAALFEGSSDNAGSETPLQNLLSDPTNLRVVEALGQIQDVTFRRALAELVETIAQTQRPRRR